MEFEVIRTSITKRYSKYTMNPTIKEVGICNLYVPKEDPLAKEDKLKVIILLADRIASKTK